MLRSVAALLLVTSLANLASAQTLLPADRPIDQVIDHYIDAELRNQKITPAPLADDPTILRRLTLDLNGRIPTSKEVVDYQAATDPAKKTKLLERLLAAPAYARQQTTELLSMLQPDEPGRRSEKLGSFRDYLKTSVDEKRPWDRVFRELLLADENDPKLKGAGEYLRSRVKDLNKLTIDVSSTFFGVNISCAQCHDHPHVKDWTQDHFYGMKSFFARTFEDKGILAEYDAGLVKYLPNKGKEKIAPVMFLTGKTLAVPNLREPTKEDKKLAQDRIETAKKEKKSPALPAYSLRVKLVETALEPGQRDFFARAIVNRLWNRFHGRGLVMPLDQMHVENPPSHPELLSWLARDLVEHGYDLNRTIRGIVASNAYARASRYDGDKAPMDKYFAFAQVRALTPTQMAASLRLATADPQTLPIERAELEKRVDAIEKSGDRLANLFPPTGDNFQVSVSEAMLFANNEAMQKDLLVGKDTLVARMLTLPELEKRAELAVRTVLCRPAKPEEIVALTSYLQRRGDRAEPACQQVVWALLTSAEFRFNY